MATITLDISTANNNFTSIDVSDATVGNNGDDAAYLVTAASVAVYKRNSSTVTTTINLLSTYLASTTLPVTYSITPADIGDTDDTMFDDGEYQMIFSITRTKISDSSTETGTQSNYELQYGNSLSCVQEKIADLPDIGASDCGCSDSEQSDAVDSIWGLYMQLQGAIFSHACAKYVQAQNKLDTLLEYCDNFDCGCL